MFKNRKELPSEVSGLVCVAAFIAFFIFLQFSSRVLYSIDSYYNAALSNFLAQWGPWYKFHWARFSVFNDYFADKEFLFHLLSAPFMRIFAGNIILGGKYAVIFFNIFFAFIYYYLLRKYVPAFAAGMLLLFLACSANFTVYFLSLRAIHLANILTLLGIYFLIEKKPKKLFIAAFLYPLSHLSFATLVFFALLIEAARFFREKEIYAPNLKAVFFGTALGCIVHPHFPNNLLYVFLNVFLVPLYAAGGLNLAFGGEVFPSAPGDAFLRNFVLFLGMYAIFTLSLSGKRKTGTATLMWWLAVSAYFIVSLFSSRFWYTTMILFFVFAASWLKDWLGTVDLWEVTGRVRAAIITFFGVYVLALGLSFPTVYAAMRFDITRNAHYEHIGRWMKKNIPAGETVYHAYWAYAQYFIGVNPQNDYLVLCDPVYMYYTYPRLYRLYSDILEGKTAAPYKIIQDEFKAHYGYTRRGTGFYRQIVADSRHFKILYQDDWGAVFLIPSAGYRCEAEDRIAGRSPAGGAL